MELEFRLLRADEIECRISQVNQYGIGLLLYKNARCDMNILDERVGALNWQRSHSRDNANCTVSIWDKEKCQWISKEDTGTESFTEKEKGLASDSFKRACFNWGIGRELYTAPDMFIFKKDLKKHDEYNGKWTCKDKFVVCDIEYKDDNICYVDILNKTSGKHIEFGTPVEEAEKQKEVAQLFISSTKVKALKERCDADGVDINVILKLYKVNALEELTETKYMNINQHWEEIKEL